RVAEGTGLENRSTGNRIVSSNLTPSVSTTARPPARAGSTHQGERAATAAASRSRQTASDITRRWPFGGTSIRCCDRRLRGPLIRRTRRIRPVDGWGRSLTGRRHHHHPRLQFLYPARDWDSPGRCRPSRLLRGGRDRGFRARVPSAYRDCHSDRAVRFSRLPWSIPPAEGECRARTTRCGATVAAHPCYRYAHGVPRGSTPPVSCACTPARVAPLVEERGESRRRLAAGAGAVGYRRSVTRSATPLDRSTMLLPSSRLASCCASTLAR